MRVERERTDLAVEDDLVDAVTVEAHRPSRARGPAVLLTHGAGKDLDAPHLVALADAFAAAGTLTVRVNQPWKQSGRAAPPPPHRATDGYRAVASAVRAVFGPRRAWVWGGHSNGARIASHAAAEVGTDTGTAADDGAPTPGALLLVSYPLHPPGKPEKLRVEHLDAVGVPLLVLQGTNDAFGSDEEVRAHLGRVPGGPEVIAVPGADHGWAVPRTRAADGRRHEPAETARTIAPSALEWLSEHVV